MKKVFAVVAAVLLVLSLMIGEFFFIIYGLQPYSETGGEVIIGFRDTDYYAEYYADPIATLFGE